jgi:hemoglobin
MALFDDIGGAPAIRAALDAFYPRVLADPALSGFFLGVDIQRLKTAQESFFAMVLGGPGAYAGRSLADAHARARGRGVNDEVFDRFLMVFKHVLVDQGVAHGKIHECLAVCERARSQILNR